MTIPPNSYHSITVQGKPLQPGVLTIRGCYVQAPGSASREFLLPLSTTEEEERKTRQRDSVSCELGRFKYSGLESKLGTKNSQRASLTKSKPPNHKFLECKVVPEQPFLRLRWSSLTHGAVMLYDGEKYALTTTFLLFTYSM